MSFDLYLNCFGETERSGLPRGTVRSLFPIEGAGSEPDFWRVRYGPADSCEINVTPLANAPSQLKFIHVNRPCGDFRLWESLYKILQMGSVVLFFPGGPLILGPGSSAEGLPADMTASLGEPVLWIPARPS